MQGEKSDQRAGVFILYVLNPHLLRQARSPTCCAARPVAGGLPSYQGQAGAARPLRRESASLVTWRRHPECLALLAKHSWGSRRWCTEQGSVAVSSWKPIRTGLEPIKILCPETFGIFGLQVLPQSRQENTSVNCRLRLKETSVVIKRHGSCYQMPWSRLQHSRKKADLPNLRWVVGSGAVGAWCVGQTQQAARTRAGVIFLQEETGSLGDRNTKYQCQFLNVLLLCVSLKKSIFALIANYCRKDWQENIATRGSLTRNSYQGEPINSIYLATQTNTGVLPSNGNGKKKCWRRQNLSLHPHKQKGKSTHLSLFYFLPCLEIFFSYMFLKVKILFSHQDNIPALGNIERKRCWLPFLVPFMINSALSQAQKRRPGKSQSWRGHPIGKPGTRHSDLHLPEQESRPGHWNDF